MRSFAGLAGEETCYFPSTDAPAVPPPWRWLLFRIPFFWSGLGLLLLLFWLGSFSSTAAALRLTQPSGCSGLGWCSGGWRLHSTAEQRRRLGLWPQLWKRGSLAMLFHSPCGCGNSTRPGLFKKCSPRQKQLRNCVDSEGLQRTAQPELVCRTTHSALQRRSRSASQRQATDELHHRKPIRSWTVANCR